MAVIQETRRTVSVVSVSITSSILLLLVDY